MQLAREVLDIAAAAVRPGITTDEIDEIVHNATIERDAYPSPLNYRGFPKSVCTFVSKSKMHQMLSIANITMHSHRSINETICHGIPDRRKLVEGDIVNIGTVTREHEYERRPTYLLLTDVTLYYDGKVSISYNVVMGTP
jgi:methionyl aminopeptidase